MCCSIWAAPALYASDGCRVEDHPHCACNWGAPDLYASYGFRVEHLITAPVTVWGVPALYASYGSRVEHRITAPVTIWAAPALCFSGFSFFIDRITFQAALLGFWKIPKKKLKLLKKTTNSTWISN